ncbi:MAG TPA: 6-phosphogluconolactonase [Actinomycetota bacterium]|nr:6-phosphogluconolactonase [Actinomycetota bacterium]
MSFGLEVFSADDYPRAVAARIAEALPGGGSVVLTGGSTAERIYPYLDAAKDDWTSVEVAFSDERCVPPDDAASNYGMAKRLLLDVAQPGRVHRIEGELPPARAAGTYEASIRPLVARGFDVLLLGMGADAHVGALFPHSDALDSVHLAAVVDRPDGMEGITLTPPAMTSAKKVIVVVTGAAKAVAVQRALEGDEPPAECPVRLLAHHPDVTFLLDEAAASSLA